LIKQREIQKALSDQDFRARILNITDEVKNEYYKILKTQSMLEAQNEKIIFLSSLLELVNRDVKEQRLLEKDSLEVKARLARAEYKQFKLKNSLATQKERFNKLLGRDVEIPFSVAPISYAAPFAVNVQDAEETALEQRRGFGNTAAMMLTIASPKESDLELELRANNINRVILNARSSVPSANAQRLSFVIPLPSSVDNTALKSVIELLTINLLEDGIASDINQLNGASFIGLDLTPLVNEEILSEYVTTFSKEKLGHSSFHIDAWDPVLIKDPSETKKKLKAVDGDKYSYRDLENITELMAETYQTLQEVSIIERSGTLDQRIYLDYSQDVFASYNITLAKIKSVLSDRKVIIPGGEVEIGRTEVFLYPSGAFNSVEEIGNVVITETQDGTPVYLRDLGEIVRGYQIPPSLLNF